ncbi:MAG: nucleotide exchange factor GrpE [Planctomycetota bacterium]|nr:MAG: nucleotide exchange factor GrpE [Planctomycetota bacterium]
MSSHTEDNTNAQASTEHEIPEIDPSTLPTDDQDAAERYEIIRQLAMSGELEYPPEAEDIVAALKDTIAQRDENHAKLIRTLADHQNYQRRAAINEREAADMARRGVVSSLIPLIDQFEMALVQDPAKVSAETIAMGVKMIRDEFLRVLSGYGVSQIAPSVGDEFNPGDHEAMIQQAAEGVEPGHISMVLSTGYKLGERVVRPAKVAVAPQNAPENE